MREPDIHIRASARDARRREARRARYRAARLRLAAVAIVVLAVFAIGWRVAASERADAETATSVERSAAAARVVAVTEEQGDPTPFFARYRSLHLYLPVDPDALGAIAFHQASGDVAQPMESLLPDADMNAARKNPGVRLVTVNATGAGPPVLEGEVLRMWRSNRKGKPDTAVDIGVPPGTPVLAPVTGTVIEVRPYRLYDKYDDYEIHIQPSGWPEIDVVLIHVDEPAVKAGDQVFGGLTRVATVRRMSDHIDHQLAGYTTDGGDHVHIQLNRVTVPGRLDGIDGGS